MRQRDSYIFYYLDSKQKIQYIYTPKTGSLNDLTVVIGKDSPFYPSNYGGPRFLVNGLDIPIWETDPTQFSYTADLWQNKSLQVKWEAKIRGESIEYTYLLTISGKTLCLQVYSTSASVSAFTLDRSEATESARIITIPYLPFFNLLLYKQHFVSAYFDWMESESSIIEKMNSKVSDQSFAFSQTVYYFPNSIGESRPLHEVIYLTVSDSLDEVLPLLPTPSSPYREKLVGKVLLDLWAERTFQEDSQFVSLLAERGITDLIVLRHNWQKCGFDNCYPTVLPANPLWGGDDDLINLSKTAQHSGYLFGLHENYVDIYPNSDEFSPDLLARDPSNNPIPAWYNHTTGIQSFLLSPSRSSEIARYIASEIHRRYKTTISYLDVSTAVNPSEKVDYNAALPQNARFRTTLKSYTHLLANQRNAHNTVVIGEGGHHFLYAGNVDAVIAEDSGREESGMMIPPLVHFDLLRIKPKMISFGVGFYPWYFSTADKPKWTGYSTDEHYIYMANEIAYCHAGYIPTPDSLGETEEVLDLIQKKVKLVASIHQLCALSKPVEILYDVHGEMKGVEEAIQQNQLWKILIKYENGLSIWVNLHPTEQWFIQVADPVSWVNSSSIIDNKRVDHVGTNPSKTFLLPPAGWVALMP